MYVVRSGDETSEPFKALVGILIGDPASPTLWNLFMSDLVLPPDIDDVMLGEVCIAILMHADDILLLSLSARGLQARMNAVYYWCSTNFLVINAIKSSCAIFNQLPAVLPVFTFGGAPVRISDRFTYVGITFQTTHRNIFAAHYEGKAQKARVVGNAILGVESMIGNLPPRIGAKLYMARVDPHLVGGCEVILDVDPPRLEVLSNVQETYIRRLLRLGCRSMIAPLHTETGLAPLHFRRVQLAVRYLGYLVALPPAHYARIALMDADGLASVGKPSWLSDLRYVLMHLPLPVSLPPLQNVSDDVLKDVINSISASMTWWLKCEMQSPKMYLLHGRLEPRKYMPAVHKTMIFRHYLDVANSQHRKALTRLVLSDHCLGVEQLRRTPNGAAIARDQRLCRFCRSVVETPEHALLECHGDGVLFSLRTDFLRGVFQSVPAFAELWQSASRLGFLKALLANTVVIGLLARFAHDVLAIYSSYPLLYPS